MKELSGTEWGLEISAVRDIFCVFSLIPCILNSLLSSWKYYRYENLKGALSSRQDIAMYVRGSTREGY